MKRYVYTYHERDRKHLGTTHTHKTVRVYRIGRTVRKVAELTETYVSEWQLVLMTMELIRGKDAPPKALFARAPMGGHAIPFASEARKLKLADITRVD